jgi:carboxymethylenebutenolidase
MSRDLRAQANWLAGEGFLAVAPDLYYWGSRLSCLRTIMRDLGQRRGRSFDDIDAADRWLRDHSECTGDVGVIGFCMGGGYAIALAAGRGFDAASVNYGGCPSDAEQVAQVRGPHDVKIYPQVGHGFMNSHDPDDQTLMPRFLARMSGTKYDEDATRDARRRIIEFFNRYLKDSTQRPLH